MLIAQLFLSTKCKSEQSIIFSGDVQEKRLRMRRRRRTERRRMGRKRERRKEGFLLIGR